jgi:hypothetical protein
MELRGTKAENVRREIRIKTDIAVQKNRGKK